MSHAPTSQYLHSKVLTAPPHKLHLMLIEGALRFGRQAEAALRRDDPAAASPPLLRMIEILGEILAGVRHQQTELNKKLAAFYLFLFRRVSEAKINNDLGKLTESLRLLEFERETWQLACEKLESESESTNGHSAAPATEKTNGHPTRQPLTFPPAENGLPPAQFGLSLEA